MAQLIRPVYTNSFISVTPHTKGFLFPDYLKDTNFQSVFSVFFFFFFFVRLKGFGSVMASHMNY